MGLAIGKLPPLEPLLWSNWRARNQGLPEVEAFEYGLYTDAWPVGHASAGLGPVQVFNPIAGGHPHEARMGIVVRAGIHRPMQSTWTPRRVTTYERYVAIDLGEEVAALLSLVLDFRCRSGGLLREFRPGEDPRGNPIGFDHRSIDLPQPRWLHATQLPAHSYPPPRRREINLEELKGNLPRYPFTSQKKAISLVRAARLYSQALWVADADPDLAWLFLVNACEVAAAEVYGSYDPKNKRRKNPTIRQATGRFIKFIVTFAPDPPSERPAMGQLDWSQMSSHAEWIYHWRSRALHDGIPFPPPMRDIPRAWEENSPPAEVPLGYATSVGTSRWRIEHTPMLLHTFAFICRQAIVRWWGRTPMTRSP